ncbi:MAG: polyribonucleotide nucleotidyltransferase [Actinomycetota bacterium]|nr:polyribonucleotide nucleotidyltransferase [Actinomycetota bacterium]
MQVKRKEIEFEGKIITLEAGRLARQANGAVIVQCEGTMVIVTAVASDEPLEDVDFFPLTVDVEEKMYAAGKIPGGFIKREGRPSEKSILNARLIDRSIRPIFPEGFRNEVQIIATIVSADQINPPDILGLIGASVALTISDIPFNGPIGAVRVSRVGERWIINPTYQELEHSDIDVVVAGNKNGILMVEAGAKEVDEESILQAMEEGQKAIIKLIEFQEEFQKEVGVHKRAIPLIETDPQVEKAVREFATSRLKKAIRIADKLNREQAVEKIREETLEEFLPTYEEKEQDIVKILTKMEKEETRRMILEEKIRSDGRDWDEIRPISCEVGILPRTHGSGLFTRGQTQVLSVATLGTVGEEQLLDGLGVEESKRFLHHYNFPPFSTGEVGFMRGPRRREIGHGALVERALAPVIPEESEFPYTIRLVSEVLESNGSTSMASVCGSTLALMDAGIPIKAPVAGIAMGLVKEKGKVAILMDILGVEDALGDMDFKVAGTAKGITALQMDLKIEGVGREILEKALTQAQKARLFILDKMTSVIAKPREKLSPFAPRIITMRISTDKIRDIIGPAGKTIHSIIDETGVTIDIEDDGTVFIASKDEVSGERARQMIEMITKEIKVGERYIGRVTRTTSFGAFVEILPGREGLVHISKLSKGRIRRVEDVVKVGDKIPVEVIEIDRLNRISLAAVDLAIKVK